MIIGAIIATAIGINLKTNIILTIPIILLGSFFFGGIYGGIAGYLKAKFEVSEIVVTVMMNYIAIYLLDYMVRGPLSTPTPWPRSPRLFNSSTFPRLIPGLRVHTGFIIALILGFIVYIFLFKTHWGFRIRTVGSQPGIAERNGIEVGKEMVFAMFLSGGIAAIAGASEVAGVHRYLFDGVSAGYGFLGIPVALISDLKPQVVIVIGLLFGFIITGIHGSFRELGLPAQGIDMLVGLLMLSSLLTTFLIRYKIRRI